MAARGGHSFYSKQDDKQGLKAEAPDNNKSIVGSRLDRVIVEHLRHARLQKDQPNNSRKHRVHEDNNERQKQLQENEHRQQEITKNIFSCYSETGEKIPNIEVSNSLRTDIIKTESLADRGFEDNPKSQSSGTINSGQITNGTISPAIHNTATPETATLAGTTEISRVLNGEIHGELQAGKSTNYLYIVSGNIDMEAELTHMQDHLYPQLREHFRRRGHELRILDLHWGFKDTVSDDHGIPQVVQRAINKAHASKFGFKFVILVGQKYGSCYLPTEIPKEEFEMILKAATDYKKKQKQILHAAIAEAAQKAATEEEKLQASVPAQSGEQDIQHKGNLVAGDDTTLVAALSDAVKDATELTANDAGSEKKQRQSVISKRDQKTAKMLRDAQDQLPDTKALRQWYRLDENSIPAVYRLQNISTQFKDISRNDAAKRQAAKLTFASIESRLQKVLKLFSLDLAGDKVDLKQRALAEKQCSVFEQEILSVFDQPTATEHTVCVMRTLNHLTDNLDDLSAGDYVDLAPGSEAGLDFEQMTRMEGIRQSIRQKLINYQTNENRLDTYSVDWAPGGIRPNVHREHLTYLDRMCKTIFDQIVSHRDLQTQIQKPLTWRQELFFEVSEHARICLERARDLQGCQEILDKIQSNILSENRAPLVVYGTSGCGKSSILAAAARRVHTWMKRQNVSPHVLVRMIGCTSDSTNIRTLLRDISRQLCHVFERDPKEIPTDYKGVVNDLSCRLQQASEQHPIIIILDGIDQLTDDYDGRALHWLPLQLPSYVHLVVSVTSDDKTHCLSAARKLLNDDKNCFLEVGQFPVEVAMVILRERLQEVKRQLTDEQWEMCKDSFKKCPLPFFLQMLTTDAVLWRSYTTSDSVKLGDTLKQAVNLRLTRLERDHDEVLTRRALGYITASRHGLTSNELEEILSADSLVMDDIMTTYKLPLRRLPALLLVRLLEAIDDLITECRGDNVITIRWAHSVIAESASERYLNQKDTVIFVHKALAEYFSTGWTGNSQKCTSNLLSSEELSNDTREIFSTACNTRSLSELPRHLLKCQKISQLKLSCLCNFEWMLARLCATSLESLLGEYHVTLRANPRDLEITIVMNSLLLSRKALINEPRQLASQLIGRLQRIVTEDNPRSPDDPKKYPHLHQLLASAKQPSVPSLIPSMECLFEPGGITHELLSGHTKAVSSATVTSDGNFAVTSSEDGTIKVWDLSSGKVIKSINGVTSKVSTIRTAQNNNLAITVKGSLIQIWDINSGKCVFSISEYIDPAHISIAADGRILAAVFDGSNMLRSWNLDSFSLMSQTQIPDNSIHKDNSILMADKSRGDNILHAFRSGNLAVVQNARNGNIFRQLKCQAKTSSIVALAVTSDYFILCCRQKTVTLQEIHALELFDTVKGTYIRSIRGCGNDNIKQLTTNLIGSHAVAASPNFRNGTSDVAVFNLETEDHKHLALHPGYCSMCVCLDFRCCVTGDAGESCLKMWNLSPVINVQVAKPKRVYGLSEIWPMADNPRYVVTKAADNGPISVWNVAKGKCLQSAVRIERGLTEGTDVLVVRNTTLVILTDRGLSSVSHDSVPVFQTLLVYDLKLKKYIRKLTGCYIVPAPSHEYTLLDSEKLLGPSDNRTHFIVWSLVSGHPVFRIKTAFRELEKAKADRTINLVDVPKANRLVGTRITVLEKKAQPRSTRIVKEDSKSARRRLNDLRSEKENAIDQFLVSGDQTTIVASFYAHHLCVFDILTHTHTQTLQTDHSMLLLHTAALTFRGSHLVHANYDEVRKVSYVTIWDCASGQVKRRLKGENEVCVIGITDEAQRVVIGQSSNELHIWDPMKTHSLKRIHGYPGFKFQVNSKLHLTENGDKAIVFSGDISVWDLVHRNVQAVFTPDSHISVCKVILNGKLILVGMYDKPELVVLKLVSREIKYAEDAGGVELFGETTGDTSDEEEDNEDNEAKEK